MISYVDSSLVTHLLRMFFDVLGRLGTGEDGNMRDQVQEWMEKESTEREDLMEGAFGVRQKPDAGEATTNLQG